MTAIDREPEGPSVDLPSLPMACAEYACGSIRCDTYGCWRLAQLNRRKSAAEPGVQPRGTQ